MVLGLADQRRIIRIRRAPTSNPALLTLSNLSLAGCFLTHEVNTGLYTTTYPMAFKRVSGVRHYYEATGDGHIEETTEPTLLDCTTAIGSLNVASVVQDWGTFTANGSDQAPGGGGIIQGLYYDTTLGKLIVSWSGSYVNLGNGINTMAILSFGATTLSTDGCYAPPYSMPYTGGPVVEIPSAFVTDHLSANQRWALTGGVYASATSGPSYGPNMIAIVPPSTPNACAAMTDYAISAGTTLAEYAKNNLGATCYNLGLGCTVNPSVLTPHPALSSQAIYSLDLYPEAWDPCGAPCSNSPTKGYFGDDHTWRSVWYADGVKEGLVVPFTGPMGWLNTTVTSSTGPGQAVLGSVDTHDGYTINVGDKMVIQTCTPGVDAGCSSANRNHESIVTIDSVNAGTLTITYTAQDNDSCSMCNHTPVAGGEALLGGVYPHGSPGFSRATLRLQIYDTAQYASVIGGSAVYSPTYTEEGSLYSMGVTSLGDPAGGQGISAGFRGPENQFVSAVLADTTAQQIIVFVKQVQFFGGTSPRSLGIVLNVAH